MRLLVIGRNGQLARALREEVPGIRQYGRADVDLTEPEAAERTVGDERPDVVINAAAYTDVERAEDEATSAYAINRDGVAALARGAAAVGAAFVHISTDYVFDGAKVGEWIETDATEPLNVYGASKLAGERAALAANPRTLILRTSWLYSPWGRNFVTTMLRLADRDRLTVVRDQHGKPTSALSLARAILGIVRQVDNVPPRSSIWGVYHYAGRGVTTWADFARRIFAEANDRLASPIPDIVPVASRDYPTRAQRPLNSALDCSAFERTFGITTICWRHALAEVIGHIKRERHG